VRWRSNKCHSLPIALDSEDLICPSLAAGPLWNSVESAHHSFGAKESKGGQVVLHASLRDGGISDVVLLFRINRPISSQTKDISRDYARLD
jgi:hypothetical protein